MRNSSKQKIILTPLQQALDEFVSASDYTEPIPKPGKLNEDQLKQFNKFFANNCGRLGNSDKLGDEVYYVGQEGIEHTFTNSKGWIQHHLFTKHIH